MKLMLVLVQELKLARLSMGISADYKLQYGMVVQMLGLVVVCLVKDQTSNL